MEAMNQESGRRAEGNQVGQGIKFPAEIAFHSAHARQTAVEQVENAGQQDERQRQFDFQKGAGVELAIGADFRLHDLGQRHKAAEQISRRHQVGQKINFQLRLGPFALRGWGTFFHTL